MSKTPISDRTIIALSVVILGLALIFSKPARSQEEAKPTVQTHDMTRPANSTPIWISGSNVTSFTNSITLNPHLTISAEGLTVPATLTIQRTAKCKLVVLEDTATKIVIGCRTELTK